MYDCIYDVPGSVICVQFVDQQYDMIIIQHGQKNNHIY